MEARPHTRACLAACHVRPVFGAVARVGFGAVGSDLSPHTCPPLCRIETIMPCSRRVRRPRRPAVTAEGGSGTKTGSAPAASDGTGSKSTPTGRTADRSDEEKVSVVKRNAFFAVAAVSVAVFSYQFNPWSAVLSRFASSPS